MSAFSRALVTRWARLGPRFLPFADVATADLPLSRWLRLSLFQVSVGMALVLLVGTLNRVMIVELHVPASLVALMVALPVLYAPARALIGFRSDSHRSALGWRRVPFMWMGTLIQFGGLAIMPFALLVLSGGGNAGAWPVWVGHAGAGLAFLLVGAGLHTTQTAGLALATDLAPVDMQPRVVGLMYVTLLMGTIVSALAFGAFLAEFSPGRLVMVIQAAAVVTLVLNSVSLWRQEVRRPGRDSARTSDASFGEAWKTFAANDGALRRLAVVGLGTLGFGMQDVLLEPYGGQVLGMSVGATTWLTATLAAGGLLGFGWASRVLCRGADAARISSQGASIGAFAFVAIIGSASVQSVPFFGLSAFMVGLGAGLFGHGTLTMTMNRAPKAQCGLALGAWGAVQATAAGVAVALGGIGRDVIDAVAHRGYFGGGLAQPVTGYAGVYAIEVALLIGAVVALSSLLRPERPGSQSTVASRHTMTAE
jgi:BCD family chlorophyll transporter-like MFS transporter